MKCRVCGVRLTGMNWYKNDRKDVYKICMDCRRVKRNEKGKMFIRNAF